MDAQKMLVKNSNSLQQKCKKLYLDSKTADVKFVFKDSDETVPAHKNILSIDNTVFDVMFYGSLPEKGDVPIADASPEAFKEFLQFFYLHEFQLTSENIFQVANLCKKYDAKDALKLCEDPMKSSLTIDNMCTGYATAKLLEIENVIKYCEQQIKQKASDVLKSNDFMECNHQLFDQILQLLSSECSASDIVDACMAWAKAECERKNVEPSPANLKIQLKSIFDQIPFTELDSEQFSRHTKTYKRFFVEDELEAMLLKMMSKKPKISEPPLDILDCDRHTDLIINAPTSLPLVVSFTSNSRLLLKEIHFRTTHLGCDAKITLHNNQSGKSLNLGTVLLNDFEDFVVPFPVFIDQDVKYAIKIDSDIKKEFPSLRRDICFLKACVKFESGVKIRFQNVSKIMPKIIFQQL